MKFKSVLIALALTVLLAGCLPMGEVAATRALEGMGLTDIKLTGIAYFGCGDDTFRQGFVATNQKGEQVSGVVCGGWLKGNTVRFD
jgi:hypothetical protein